MARLLRSSMLLIAFAAAYALAVVAGRATRLGSGEVALVWPAAAVAIIWVLTVQRCGPRERLLHVLVLGVVTFAVNIAFGTSVPMSAWFGLVNVAQAVITVAILAHRRDKVELRDPGDLARLLVAVATGTVCAAALATTYFAVVLDAAPGQTFALFAVRNGTSALLGLALWLRLQHLEWKWPRLSWSALVEASVVGAGVTLIFVWIFWLNTGVPMAFLALVAAMWVTLRYSTAINMAFLLVAGVWIIYATLLGKGVFIVQDIEARAMLSQAMVCSLTVIVLTLSLYRDSRARLIAQLRQARDLFAGVLEAASEQAIIGTDPQGHITVFNNGAERLLGWTEAEMLGRTPLDYHLQSEVRARADQLGIAMRN
ncbi:MAG: MASE1 domain-containing protein, partial [Mycobacterium sp.]|nr:MASE1 domain-containing protein [Mycobacterium sp.]